MLTQFELTVNGVRWGIPAGGGASVNFPTDIYVDGSFEITQPFTFEGSFTGAPEPFAPGLGCDVLKCETFTFGGDGIVTFGLYQYFDHPDFWVLGRETFTILSERIPEPSTASLLLIGFAGLALLARRRKSRATLIQAG